MKNSFSTKDYIYITLICIFVFLFYYARQGFVSIPSLLWAEDGSIALSGVYKNGFTDLFEPYYGYLHIYTKLAAYISYLTDIIYAPIIFLIAYLIPLFIFIYLLYAFILSLNSSKLFTALLTLTVFLMPYGNELILNVTYIKWYLYILLILYIIYDDAEKVLTPYVYYPTYTVFLFGGFISVFLAPVIVFKIFVEKYILKLKIKTSSIIICSVTLFVATIQAIFMFNDTRFVEPVKNNLLSYLELLLNIFILGANKYVDTYIFSIIFSILFIYLVYKFVRGYIGADRQPKDRRFYLFLYIVFAVCVYVPSFYTLNIASVSPSGGGSRYVFPLFMLIAILIPILTSNKKYLTILISAIFLLNLGNVIHGRLKGSDHLFVREVSRVDYPFNEFVKFAKAESGIIIPMNPHDDSIGNLDIHNSERKIEPIIFDLDKEINVDQREIIDIYNIASTSCSNAKDIGVKFYITSSGSIIEKSKVVVRVTLLNKLSKKELPLKVHRFTDKIEYPIKVDGKQRFLTVDNDNESIIYPVALNLNEYDSLVIETANASVNIDKLELFCLD